MSLVDAASGEGDDAQSFRRVGVSSRMVLRRIAVGGEHIACYVCHTSHGSTTLPHLLVTGRVPGLTSVSQASNGGSCTSTCHGSQSWTVNYGR